MDPQAAKHVVPRFNAEVIQNGDRQAFEQLVSPDFVNRSALSDLRVTIHDQVAEDGKVTTRKTITDVHTGELMAVAATGRTVTIEVIDLVKGEDGRYAEHWGINTLPSVLARLRAE